MECLDERLQSFSNWPHKSPTADELAHHGFYHDPTVKNPDRVACHLCSVAVFNWKPHDTPLDRHRQAYCECPLVIIYSQQSYPIKQQVRQARRSTFGKWWPHNKPFSAMPYRLAQAGFVFAPTIKLNDQCECLYCHVKFAQWQPDDDPLQRHKSESPECPFILELSGEAQLRGDDGGSLQTLYSPKLRGSRSLDVSYTEGDDFALDVKPTDEKPVKRGPGRPRKYPRPEESLQKTQLSPKINRQSAPQPVIDSQPLKKRKYERRTIQESPLINNSELPVSKSRASILSLEDSEYDSDSSHVKVDDVLSKFRQLSNEFEQRINKLAASYPAASNGSILAHQQAQSATVDFEAQNQKHLEEVSLLKADISQLQEKLASSRSQNDKRQKEENTVQQYQLATLKRELKEAQEEISFIKKENHRLKHQATTQSNKSLPRGGALQSLPVQCRRRWYQDEVHVFEARLGFFPDDTIQSLVSDRPLPFICIQDIPWPISPSMMSASYITLPMITSFLMSDLPKSEFDDFCQYIISKFEKLYVQQWIHFVVERERQSVLDRSHEVYSCLVNGLQSL